MARFSNRTLRITRQRESATFQHYIMPASSLISLAGVLGVLLVIFDYRINERWEPTAFAAAASAALLPVALLLYRWIRGHFNSQLEHP